MQSQQRFRLSCVQPGPVERQSSDFLALSVQQCDVGVRRWGHVRARQRAHRGRGHRRKACSDQGKRRQRFSHDWKHKPARHRSNKHAVMRQQKPTCRFDNIMRSGPGDLASVLVHTPAVGGLSVTLDWTEAQHNTLFIIMNSPLWFTLLVCGLYLNCPSGSH